MESLLSASLEKCSEISGDITDEVYERFFANCKDAVALMEHSDEHMKGRMLAQVFELLLADEDHDEDGYLGWEINNHLLAYGVDVEMYRSFLDALCATVKQSLGTAWTTTLAQAWANSINTLLDDIYSEAKAL